MAQKYCKVGVSISIGNRKASVVDPIEVEAAVNSFDGELNTLLLNVVDAIRSLPGADGSYTIDDIKDAMCSCFNLQLRQTE